MVDKPLKCSHDALRKQNLAISQFLLNKVKWLKFKCQRSKVGLNICDDAQTLSILLFSSFNLKTVIKMKFGFDFWRV